MSETLPEFTRETLTWISKRTISAGLPRTHHYKLQDRLSRIIAGYALFAPDDGWPADVNDGYKSLCESIRVDPHDAYARAWEAAKQDGLHKPPLPMPHELDMERIVHALELMAAPEEQRQENVAGTENSSIISIGHCQYRVGDGEPITVSGVTEDNVLQAFLEHSTMDQNTLVKISGVSHAPKILKSLASKYPAFTPFIRLPGRARSGGYHVTISKSQ